MNKKKTTTVSMDNTPVRRALAGASRKLLIALLVAGFAAGIIYGKLN